MLSKSDEEILIDRLRNWGRWAADRDHLKANVLYRMMVLAGEIIMESPELGKIDDKDALEVQRAWAMLPQSPRRYLMAKWILAAHYAYPSISKGKLCRHNRIRLKEYDELLKMAQSMIFNKLEYMRAKKEAQDIDNAED